MCDKMGRTCATELEAAPPASQTLPLLMVRSPFHPNRPRRRPRRRTAAQACLLVFLLCFALSAASNRTRRDNNEMIQSAIKRVLQIGPVRLPSWASNKIKPPAFVWKAAVNHDEGLASAVETSELPPSSPLYKAVTHHPAKNDKALLRTTQKLFASYPAWLCSGRVTFGLLRAVKSSGRNNNNNNGAVDVSFLGLVPLLRLGPPRGERVSYTSKESAVQQKQQQPQQAATTTTTTSHFVWTLPITGGLMAVRPPAAASLKTPPNLGSVVFCLKQQTIQGGLQGSVDSTRCHLQTELVDYRPLLVGSGVPSNILRSSVYLGSQSLIHALVMWRFHRRCRAMTMEQVEELDI